MCIAFVAILLRLAAVPSKSWVVELHGGSDAGYAGYPSAAAVTDGTASKANGSYVVAYEAASSQHGSMCLGDAYIEMALVNPDGGVVHTYELVQPITPRVKGVPFAPVVQPNTQFAGSVFDL